MRKTARLPALMALVVAMAAASVPVSAQDAFARDAGTRRLLVLIAPDSADRRLGTQRAALAGVGDGLAERDLVVVEGIGRTAEAGTLRRRFLVPDGAFRVILVGKDGGAKLVSAEPVPVADLFARIDAMPMRRREMERR